MEYDVTLKESKEGYAVWVPGLPGCCSQGRTKAEALENIKDAITEYLAVAKSLAKKQGTPAKVRIAA